MSSEISSIDLWTGSALSCFATTSPKRRPAAQTTSPKRSSVWPDTPRNDSRVRSGRTRLASPPPWCAAPAATTRELTIEDRIMALTGSLRISEKSWKIGPLRKIALPAQKGSPDTTDPKGFLASERPGALAAHRRGGAPARPAARKLPRRLGAAGGRLGRAGVHGREVHVEIPRDSAGVHDALHDPEGHGLVRLDVHHAVPLRARVGLVDELPALLLVPQPLLERRDVEVARVPIQVGDVRHLHAGDHDLLG